MTETLTGLKWWGKFIEDDVKSFENLEHIECPFGDKVCDDLNFWSTLIYSPVTGWQQILWFNDSPQKDHVIVRIKYYPSAYAALLDNSIFPAGSIVAFGSCWYGRTKQDRQNEIQN